MCGRNHENGRETQVDGRLQFKNSWYKAERSTFRSLAKKLMQRFLKHKSFASVVSSVMRKSMSPRKNLHLITIIVFGIGLKKVIPKSINERRCYERKCKPNSAPIQTGVQIFFA